MHNKQSVLALILTVENIKQESIDALEASKSDLTPQESVKIMNNEILSDQEADAPLIEFLPFKAGETTKAASAIRVNMPSSLIGCSSYH
jgi:hypothetical protein